MTTTTLRPDATITAPSSVVGAASSHAALSDNSDASYAVLNPGFDGAVVDMGTVAMGSGAVAKSGRLRARARTTGVNADDETLRVVANVAGSLTEGFPSGSPTIDNYSSAYFPLISGAVPTTQAEIDGLQFSYEPVGTATHWVYELYFDLIYVTRPVAVVTAVTPDPVTATNVVPIAWTNTLDADGGVQTRYQIRVFTAAQYGIGGFDPATSPATQDTGEVVGAALARNTAVLANSTTYRAYVRVAQTVNGVSHWSAYAFDQFAISVVTSDILSVTTVAVNASARIDVTVNRNTGTSAWNFVEVERSTNAGVTWSPVRGATYVDATGNANTFTVSDYETANGQATIYRARATRIVSLLPITGAFVQSTPAVSWTSASAWLKSPSNPTKNSPVLVAGPVESSTSVDRGVFNVLGLAAPVVVSDVRRLTVGRITFQTGSDAAIATLQALLDDSELLFQAPADWSVSPMYISIGDVGRERGPMEGFAVTRWPSSYVEIDSPRDPLASAP